jgi:hypothetical protein
MLQSIESEGDDMTEQPKNMPGCDPAQPLQTLCDLLNDILNINQEFRDGMPDNWDGDSLQDACDPWPGFWPDGYWPQDDTTEIDHAICKVRADIAKAIRSLGAKP